MDLLDKQIVEKYKVVALEMLQLSFASLSLREINEAVDYSLLKRAKDHEAVINNNYKHKTIDSTLLEITEYILECEPIITSFGVLFNKHIKAINPIAKMLDKFISERKMYKKEMYKYPKGSEMFAKYNLLQLLSKIDANGMYGALGAPTCIFFNLYVASSTTVQGRSAITSAILLFESFLANNFEFGSLDEVVTYIHNVINEEREYNDYGILDSNVLLQNAYYQLMSHCGFGYIPDEEDKIIVWEMMMNLSQENLNRLYYKNNLYEFMENKVVSNAMILLLQTLEFPYYDPNSKPKEISNDLDQFYNLLKEYVYYGYQFIDRMDKAELMMRDVTVICDTDSSILSLDAWYRYNLDKSFNIPMKIKTEVINPVIFMEEDEFGECDLRKAVEFVDPVYEYDFYTDEMIELQRTIQPCVFIPQEGLRYSIINIMAYCLSQLISDFMVKFTKNSNSYNENKPCYMNMKNEFLFLRALVKDGKKNYASILELQEGHKVPEKSSLDIKGLAALTKITNNEATRTNLRKILYEDILRETSIDQVKILKRIAKAEKNIFDSINAGEKKYFKPLNVKSLSSYELPMRIQGIKASLIYNTLRDETMEAIDMEVRNSIDVIKIDINKRNVENIKESYPEVYYNVIELMNKYKEFKAGIDVIAMPLNVEIPKWVLQYVDYNTIISNNLSGFPLEQIGLNRGNKTNNYTNIVNF